MELLNLVANGGAEEGVETGETQSGGEAEEADVRMVGTGVENAGDDEVRRVVVGNRRS